MKSIHTPKQKRKKGIYKLSKDIFKNELFDILGKFLAETRNEEIFRIKGYNLKSECLIVTDGETDYVIQIRKSKHQLEFCLPEDSDDFGQTMIYKP